MARSSQVRIIGDVLCPLASPHREISFGSRLQAPGDPPDEMFPMSATRLFPEHLAIFLTQTCYVRAAQSRHVHLSFLLFLARIEDLIDLLLCNR